MISGSLFLSRGVGVQVGAAWAMIAPVRYLSYGIDSILLTAALLLAVSLPSGAFANGWLAVKLVLLVAYILAGSLALKRAPGRGWKLVSFLLALILFAAMYVTARSHDPAAALRVIGL